MSALWQVSDECPFQPTLHWFCGGILTCDSYDAGGSRQHSRTQTEKTSQNLPHCREGDVHMPPRRVVRLSPFRNTSEEQAQAQHQAERQVRLPGEDRLARIPGRGREGDVLLETPGSRWVWDWFATCCSAASVAGLMCLALIRTRSLHRGRARHGKVAKSR
jgi:hypothetical protein